MHRRFKLFLALLLLPLCIAADDTGCVSESSSAVDQERIRASYWLLYDAQADTTYARAQFRFGSGVGTTLILDDGASVEFNDRLMTFNELLDWHEVVLPGRVDGTFVYVDADGARFENAAPSITEAHVPGDFPGALDSRQSYGLTWDGPALAEDELMEVIVAHAANGFQFARFERRGEGSSDVVLGADGLSTVGIGPAVVQLRRHRDFPLEQQSAAGGEMTVTYHSPERAVALE